MKQLSIILMPLVFLAACKEEEIVTKEPIRSVKTLVVSEASTANSRQISGVVKTSNESNLSFRVAGRVETVKVNVGDRVRKGQVLAQLDPKEYALDVVTQEAKLSSARADLVERSDHLDRQKKLSAKQFATKASVEQAQAAYDAARSSVDIAIFALKTVRNNFADTTLKAPFDGIIAKRSADPYNEVSVGETIFLLQSTGGYKVEVLMPETLIRDVNYGDPVSVKLAVNNTHPIGAIISQIGSQAETGNAFPVEVTLSESFPNLRSGMTATVTFNYGESSDTKVFLLPLTALDVRVPVEEEALDKKKALIFVFDPKKSQLEKRTITIRDIRENDLEVIDGLKAGDQVVVAGVPFLQNGQQVKRWQPTYNTPALIKIEK